MSDQYKKKQAPKKKARDEFNEDELFQAPVILRDPSSRQARLGSRVVIRITANGKPLPSFQWFHNGKRIVGANTDRLTLTKVRHHAIGAYHCEAKNFVGKAVSRVAMLGFFAARIPKLVVEPELSKIEEGKPFVLKVVSSAASELKDFKIHWVFNGMRIKGAHGTELSISAAKKKYEGEYKAMIATGFGLETSNMAKVILKAAKVNAKAPEPAEIAAPASFEEGPKTLEKILAEEPKKILTASSPSEGWEDFNFDPESEEGEAIEENSLVAPISGGEQYGNTSPGTPGAPKVPIFQLATQDLIRAVAAQGGASELIEEVRYPSSLIEEVAKEAPEDDLIQDWGIAPMAKPPLPSVTPIHVPAPKRVNPSLARKKEFLENFLQRWQSHSGKKSARAA